MAKLYSSKIGRNEPQIDFSNYKDFLFHRDRNPDQGFRTDPGEIVHGGAVPPPDNYAEGLDVLSHPAASSVIPMDEWPARIEEMERTKTRLSDYGRKAGIRCKHQNGLLYCWMYGTVSTVEYARAVANKPHVELSPCAAADAVTGGRMRGGFCEEAIRFLAKDGCPELKYWPNLEWGRTARRYDTDETWANAALYKADKWKIGPQKTRSNVKEVAQMQATSLLDRIPFSAHYYWWRHIVCALDLVCKASRDAEDLERYGFRIRNSHGKSYGQDGHAILWLKRGIADRWAQCFVA